MALLAVRVDGSDAREIVLHRTRTLVLGRSPDLSDVVLDHPQVSKAHLEIRCSDRQILVRDLASKNGTTHNGNPLTHPTPLHEGDLLCMGATVYLELVSGTFDESLPEPADVIERALAEAPPAVALPAIEVLRTERAELEAHRWVIARLNTTTALPDVRARLRLLVDEARVLLGGGGAAAVTWTGNVAGSSFQYDQLVREHRTVELPSRGGLPRSMLGAMVNSRRAVWSDDVKGDDRFAHAHSVQQLSTDAAGCLPIGSGGALFVFPPHHPTPTQQRQLELLCQAVAAWLPGPQVEPADQTQDHEPLPGLVGTSRAMVDLVARVRAFAPLPIRILLVGERGTGKTQVAHAIHALSRPDRPFVIGDCGTLQEGTAASTLFGHEKGAFTNADRRHTGLVERVGDGTLFLDEIAELPDDVQRQLLVLLSESTFARVGGHERLPFRGRVIAATNRALDRTTRPSTLRADLYDRLSSVVIRVPPLRERRQDIPTLARPLFDRTRREFIAESPALAESLPTELAPDTLGELSMLPFPGNVRDLGHTVVRGLVQAIATQCTAVTPDHIEELESDPLPDHSDFNFDEVVRAFGRRLIVRALRQADGSKAGAARLLGLGDSMFRRRWDRYGVHIPDPAEE